jgi:hypothetical protein
MGIIITKSSLAYIQVKQSNFPYLVGFKNDIINNSNEGIIDNIVISYDTTYLIYPVSISNSNLTLNNKIKEGSFIYKIKKNNQYSFYEKYIESDYTTFYGIMTPYHPNVQSWDDTNCIFVSSSLDKSVAIIIKTHKVKSRIEYNYKVITIANLNTKNIIKQTVYAKENPAIIYDENNYYVSGDGKTIICVKDTILEFYDYIDNFSNITYKKTITDGTFNKDVNIKVPYTLYQFAICKTVNNENKVIVFSILNDTEILVLSTSSIIYSIIMSPCGTNIIVNTYDYLYVYEWEPYRKIYKTKFPALSSIGPSGSVRPFQPHNVCLSNSGILAISSADSGLNLLNLEDTTYNQHIYNIFKNEQKIIIYVEEIENDEKESALGYELLFTSGTTNPYTTKYIYLSELSHKEILNSNDAIKNIYGIDSVDKILYNNSNRYREMLYIKNMNISGNNIDQTYLKQNLSIASFIASNFSSESVYNINPSLDFVTDYFIGRIPITDDNINPYLSFIGNTVKYKVGYDSLVEKYNSIKTIINTRYENITDIDYTNVILILKEITLTNSYNGLLNHFNK